MTVRAGCTYPDGDLCPPSEIRLRMPLTAVPSHPSGLSYVLKLHRDCNPAQGSLCGRIEHVASGEVMAFSDADGLVGALLRHASSQTSTPPIDPDMSP